MLLRTLRARLAVAIAAVVLTVAGVGYGLVRALTPTLFARDLRAQLGRPSAAGSAGALGTGAGQGRGAGHSAGTATSIVPADVDAAYHRALSVAALTAAIAGAVVALTLATLLLRSLFRRLAQFESATRRIAAGDYHAELDPPPERELATLAESINALAGSLRATEETRAQLMSDLAHELRNPLTTIEGSMEALIDGVLPADDETFSSIAEEAGRLRRLTGDLSLLARAQESALSLQHQPLDLGALAKRVADRLQPQYDVKGVNLHLRVDGPHPVVGDADRLLQAITNIVGNALTHTPAGGSVTVSASHDDAGGRRLLEVADTGRGLEPEQLELIFERFTRVDPNGPGLGIGLNIARAIVRAHGGDVSASSAGRNAGATFTVWLPAGAAAAPAVR